MHVFYSALNLLKPPQGYSWTWHNLFFNSFGRLVGRCSSGQTSLDGSKKPQSLTCKIRIIAFWRHEMFYSSPTVSETDEFYQEIVNSTRLHSLAIKQISQSYRNYCWSFYVTIFFLNAGTFNWNINKSYCQNSAIKVQKHFNFFFTYNFILKSEFVCHCHRLLLCHRYFLLKTNKKILLLLFSFCYFAFLQRWTHSLIFSPKYCHQEEQAYQPIFCFP